MSKLVSRRVKKTPQTGITSDRYQFLGLDQAEPDLGDPIIGPSSTGANPYTGDITESYVLISDNSSGGKRYWTKQTNIIAGGIIQPGNITVRDEGNIIGSVNQINDINFIGSGVTVSNPASWSGSGSNSVDIQISVFDVVIPSGQAGSVGFRDSNSFLQGASTFIFNPINGNVGIGTTIPRARLDVLGNALISGILTVGILSAQSGNFSQSLRVGNFEIADNTTFVRIISGSIGIGTTNPIATLDVRGTVNVSGAATFNSITVQNATINQLTANRITTGFITATNGFVGIQTSNTLNTGNFISTSLNSNVGVITNLTGVAATITNLTSNNVNIINTLQVDTNTLFVTSSKRGVGFGTTNPTQKIQVGSGTSVVVITDNSRIGIGTTNPRYNLDVVGNIGFSSFIFINGNSGTENEVLLSGGTNPPTWGAPTNITVGSANSVGIAVTQESVIYYPIFTKQTQNNAQLRIDTTGITFNPALNFLGIGTTTPSSNLDVIGDVKATTVSVANTISIGVSPVSNLSSGIVTTTSTAQVIINSINTGLFRSSRYNVQVTCIGQLVGSATSASPSSIGSLRGGTNYLSGVYYNVPLTTLSGSGLDARADITVVPRKYLIIDSISNGRFNSIDTNNVVLNAPINFSRSIPSSPLQNSKVTQIDVTDFGSGYTNSPTVTISLPTNNPPIPGVTGSGVQATASVNQFNVSNVEITDGGLYTDIPTISFDSPIGVGYSAIGDVGIGVSSIRVTNSGFGYDDFPDIVAVVGIATRPPMQYANVAISTIFLTNIYVSNTGVGYTSGNIPIITVGTPQVGLNTATVIVNSLGISSHFTIVPGIGYTQPPILTVTSPNVGINTATLTSTLGISSIRITSSGTGYTSSSTIQIATSPNVTGFAATVGLGVTTDSIITSGGSGYNSIPTVTFSPPDVGFNTAIGQFQNRNVDTGVLSDFVIQNPGSGYFNIPTVTVTGGGGVGAGITITKMGIANVIINNVGHGVQSVSFVSFIDPVGSGAVGITSMGIGKVSPVGFGSGYNLPPIVTVTPSDGITGFGASVVAGLGLTSTNITVTNPGYGYSVFPTITISSPLPVSIASSAVSGMGITGIVVNNPGIGYSGELPTVEIRNQSTIIRGSGAAAVVSQVGINTIFITNIGAGYTAADLSSLPIATFNPPGASGVVGFGISTIQVNNLGIGYTSAASVIVTIGSPNLSTGVTARAIASLGSPGILAGPGVSTTGETRIYYVNSIDSNSIGISTGVGIGTVTNIDIADALFTADKPIAMIGGNVSNVFIVSPGSGYTATSVLEALNFDGANVGSGFSFTSSVVVNNYQFSDLMILQSVGSASTTCDFLEYGTIANNEILGSFNSNISGANARLLFTPTYRNNTIKVSTHSITN
jgi:hypothetical protein